MRKYLSLFCTAALVSALVCVVATGCGNTPAGAGSSSDGYSQVQEDGSGSLDQPPASSEESGEGHSPDVDRDAADDLPASYVYTAEDNIIPMSESATIDGITWQILACEKTTEFGDRKLENLNYFYGDNDIDDKGNLLKGHYYMFVTFRYTNTTDSEVEILRNAKGISWLDERYIIREYATDCIYIDEYWNGGAPNEVYHYRLAPGESVTSELGYIVRSEVADEVEESYRECMALRFADCWTDFGGSTDPDAVFVELEY